jgi:hypothetical protein
MNKRLKIVGMLAVMGMFSGCVSSSSTPKPYMGVAVGTAKADEYGVKPKKYVSSIKSYFSTKLTNGALAQYKFAEPKRAYKRKGLAYGGDIDWKGWLVETSVATQNRTGRWLTPKPYLVLFSDEQIVEDILGNTHKLVVKVDK